MEVTKQDLIDLESRFDKSLAGMEQRLTEAMRDMQTEFLRGFEAFSGA